MSSRLFYGAVVAALMCSAVAGCAVYGDVPYRHPALHVDIPPGHMPPPGECRIWFPDRPPGQQPAPGNCHELQYQVPPGAILVQG